ncbi:unnamed protein product, partial [marine sediment metagenome]
MEATRRQFELEEQRYGYKAEEAETEFGYRGELETQRIRGREALRRLEQEGRLDIRNIIEEGLDARAAGREKFERAKAEYERIGDFEKATIADNFIRQLDGYTRDPKAQQRWQDIQTRMDTLGEHFDVGSPEYLNARSQLEYQQMLIPLTVPRQYEEGREPGKIWVDPITGALMTVGKDNVPKRVSGYKDTKEYLEREREEKQREVEEKELDKDYAEAIKRVEADVGTAMGTWSSKDWQDNYPK